MIVLLATAVLATTAPTEPRAEGLAPGKPAQVHRLKHRLALDVAVTAGAAAAWVSTESFLKHSLAPARCSWCDRDAEGRDTLNGLDAWGRGLRAAPEHLEAMDMASNVVGMGVLPVAVLASELLLTRAEGAPAEVAALDLLYIAEAVVLASALNQTVKFLLGRERPFVHAMDEADRALTRQPDDNNLSFYSGHSSFAFSLATAAGTIATLRGYRYAWAVWAVTVPLALSVPLLRMAADRHYVSDVLTGSAMGAAIGLAIPLLLHGREEVPPVSLTMAPGGVGLAGRF